MKEKIIKAYIDYQLGVYDHFRFSDFLDMCYDANLNDNQIDEIIKEALKKL